MTKMTSCRACGAMISANASTCPRCGTILSRTAVAPAGLVAMLAIAVLYASYSAIGESQGVAPGEHAGRKLRHSANVADDHVALALDRRWGPEREHGGRLGAGHLPRPSVGKNTVQRVRTNSTACALAAIDICVETRECRRRAISAAQP